MAEQSFEEQIAAARRWLDVHYPGGEYAFVDGLRDEPGPVLSLVPDDELRAACRERGIELAENEYEQIAQGWRDPQGLWWFRPPDTAEDAIFVPVYVRRAVPGV